MITYGSTTLTSYNTITKIEVYYYKSTSATSLSGGSWSTTKPTWENGKYIWQKIRTTYEGKLENGQFYSESDPVNITGQQGATGTAAYSYKLNASDSIIGKTKDGEYTIKKITFSATYKQGTGAVSAYGGRFKIESTTNGSTWKTEYTSSGNEASKEFTIPDDIIAIKCSLYQSDGTTVLLDIVTVPVVKDGVDAIGLRDSIPYYLASDKDTGITKLTQGWTRYRPQLTAEKKYLWVYYVSRYSEGSTEPELIETKDDLVHFVNNGNESPVESCVVDIEPVQEGSGDPSPDNVRPITGWIGCEVERTGGNIFDKATVVQDALIDDVSGAEKARIRYVCSDYISVIPNATYYIKSDQTGGAWGAWYDKDKNFISGIVGYVARAQDSSKTKTAPSNARYMRLTIVQPLASGANTGNVDTFSINYPSTDHDYHPYKGRTYSITFPSEAGTVYGGQLNVTTGELTVDRAMVDLGTLTWDYLPSNKLFSTTVYGKKPSITEGAVSHYANGDWWSTWADKDCVWCGNAANAGFVVKDTRFTDAATFKAAMSGVQFVYYLAEPIHYPLTPQEITMLCQENNIFADTGQTAISYYDNQTSTDPYVDYSLTSAFDASTDALDKAKEVAQDLADLGEDLQAQIDEKIQTFYQSTNPASSWTTTELRTPHDGDLWYYTGTSTSTYTKDNVYRYNASNNTWSVYSASGELFDKIDGKSTIYYGTTSGTYTGVETGDYLVDSTDGSSYRWNNGAWVKVTDYKTTITNTIDAIEIGGRNLLYSTPKTYSATSYAAYDFELTEPLESARTYTIQLWNIDVSHSAKTAEQLGINVYYCGDAVTFGGWIGTKYFTNGHADHLLLTFTPTEANINHSNVTGAVKKFIRIYNSVPSVSGTLNMSIEKWQLEKGTKATDWSPAPEDINSNIQQVQDNLDNLEIGGRNLLKNSKALTDNWQLNQATVSDGIVTVTPTASGDRRMYQMPANGYWTWTLGQEYTVSVAARSDNGATFLFQANGAGKRSSSIPVTSDWQRYSFTFIAISASGSAMVFAMVETSGKTIQFKEPKLEYGGKATDWTPAPEDTQADIDTAIAQSVEYIVGTQTATTGTWTGKTVDKELKVGKTIAYKLPYSGSGNASLVLTLADNTTTNAIAVYLNTTRVTTHFGAGSVINMTYDGQYWRASSIPNSNTVGVYGGAFTAGTNGVRGYSLIMKDTQNTWVSITTSAGSNSTNAGNGTNHAKYTGGLYFDTVMYEGSNANYASGASIGTCYTALAIDLRYSTNCGSTLIKGRDVYLVGTITNGLFYLDNTWWTQTLPTSQNDKVYIYLGSAYSTTSIYLVENNPAYMYYEGKFLTLKEIETEKAKKTATNYMSSDNTGIMVADLADGEQLPANATGKNVFITAGYGSGDVAVNAGVHIRNGQEDLAFFGETAQIGKSDQGYIILDNDSVDIKNDDNVLASFGATSVIGDENDWHQTIAANQITFAKGNDIITYISPDKLYTINAEVADAFYISNYSIRNASDGKLVIGLRR